MHDPRMIARLGRTASLTAAGAIGTAVVAFVLNAVRADHTLVFVVSGLALAGLATMIGQGT